MEISIIVGSVHTATTRNHTAGEVKVVARENENSCSPTLISFTS